MAADAMRNTPPYGAAGKRARRFLAASSGRVIRVVPKARARRIGAPDMCRPHASLLAAAAAAYEPRALSRRAERRRPATPLARCVINSCAARS